MAVRPSRFAAALRAGAPPLSARELEVLQRRVEIRAGLRPRPRPLVPYPVLAAGLAGAVALLWFTGAGRRAADDGAALAGAGLAAPAEPSAAARPAGLPLVLAEFDATGDLARASVAGFASPRLRAAGGTRALWLSAGGTPAEPLEVRVAVPGAPAADAAAVTVDAWCESGEALLGVAAELADGTEVRAAPARRVAGGAWRAAEAALPAAAVARGGGVRAVRVLVSAAGPVALRRVTLWRGGR